MGVTPRKHRERRDPSTEPHPESTVPTKWGSMNCFVCSSCGLPFSNSRGRSHKCTQEPSPRWRSRERGLRQHAASAPGSSSTGTPTPLPRRRTPPADLVTSRSCAGGANPAPLSPAADRRLGAPGSPCGAYGSRCNVRGRRGGAGKRSAKPPIPRLPHTGPPDIAR